MFRTHSLSTHSVEVANMEHSTAEVNEKRLPTVSHCINHSEYVLRARQSEHVMHQQELTCFRQFLPHMYLTIRCHPLRVSSLFQGFQILSKRN